MEKEKASPTLKDRNILPNSLSKIFSEEPKLLTWPIFASACIADSLQKTSKLLGLKSTAATNASNFYYWLGLQSFQAPFNLTYYCKVTFSSESISQKFSGYLIAFFSIDFKKLVAVFISFFKVFWQKANKIGRITLCLVQINYCKKGFFYRTWKSGNVPFWNWKLQFHDITQDSWNKQSNQLN